MWAMSVARTSGQVWALEQKTGNLPTDCKKPLNKFKLHKEETNIASPSSLLGETSNIAKQYQIYD
jgi:hypothetical protein